MDLDILREDLLEKKLTDIVLVLKDSNVEIRMHLHKIILYCSCEYFRKMILFNFDKPIQCMNVSSAGITRDIILLFYGIQPEIDNYPEWFYILETIKCRNYMCLQYDHKLLYNLKVPEQGFELLLDVLDLFDMNNHKGLVQTIKDNLPANYDLCRFSKNLVGELEKKNLLGTANYEGIIKIWDLDDNKLVKTIDTKCGHNPFDYAKNVKKYGSFITYIQFSRDNKYIITDHRGKEIIVWDIETGHKVNIITISYNFVHGDYTSQIVISPNNKIIVYLSCGWIYVCKIDTGTIIHRVEEDIDICIEKIAISDNGKLFAGVNYCSPTYTIRIWDIKTGEVVKTLTVTDDKNHTTMEGDQIQNIKFVNNDTEILIINSYSVVTKWNIDSGIIVNSEGICDDEGIWGVITCNAVISNNNEYVAELRDNKRLKLIPTNNTRYSLQLNKYVNNHARDVRFKKGYRILFTQDDKKLVILNLNDDIIIIDANTFENVMELNKNDGIECMTCSN